MATTFERTAKESKTDESCGVSFNDNVWMALLYKYILWMAIVRLRSPASELAILDRNRKKLLTVSYKLLLCPMRQTCLELREPLQQSRNDNKKHIYSK